MRKGSNGAVKKILTLGAVGGWLLGAILVGGCSHSAEEPSVSEVNPAGGEAEVAEPTGAFAGVRQFFRAGGFAMYPLALCSLLALAVIFEKLLVFSYSQIDQGSLMDDLRAALERGHLEEARITCAGERGPVARVLRQGLLLYGAPRVELEETLERMKAIQLAALEKRLPVLSTIGAVAPFIGLFGTVLGIMDAFQRIQATGATGLAVVGGGISEALIATAAGLFVAIVAVVANNLFQSWANGLALDMDLASAELVHLMTQQKGS